jgi:hypothetical protein
MAHGFRAYNNSGFTQVDETTQGYQVLATGIVAATNASTLGYVDIPASFPDDIMVVAKPHNPNTSGIVRLIAYFYDVVGGNGVRTRRAFMNHIIGTLATGACDYAIIQRCSLFDDSVISGQTPQNYGLNVYRSDGTLSFTTEKPTFRVRAARHHEITATSVGAGYWYVPASSADLLDTYALAMNYRQYKYRVFGPDVDREYSAVSRVAMWNYPLGKFGTTTLTSGGQSAWYVQPVEKVWEGHRTEMVGFVV